MSLLAELRRFQEEASLMIDCGVTEIAVIYSEQVFTHLFRTRTISLAL